MLTLKVSILIALLFFIINVPIAWAQNNLQLDLPKISINPGSFYYPFKRLIEKGQVLLNFTPQSKINFYNKLLRIRLSELNNVVNSKALSEIQTSSERFAFHAGKLAESVEKESKEEKEKIIKEFEKYIKFLDQLRDKYPANSSYWMLIQHDINTLSILIDRLKT